MSKIIQTNDLLRNELGKLISRDIPSVEYFITIVKVDCSPNLSHAKINISVMPEKFYGTALKELRSHSSRFSQSIRKNTKLRTVPKFNWTIDPTEKEANELEELLDMIGRGEI